MISCSLMQNVILYLMAKILLLKNVIVWWHLIFPTEIPLIMSVPASPVPPPGCDGDGQYCDY